MNGTTENFKVDVVMERTELNYYYVSKGIHNYGEPMTKYYHIELQQGVGNKPWRVQFKYGINSKEWGSNSKEFDSLEEAQIAYAMIIEKKKGKGYTELKKVSI